MNVYDGIMKGLHEAADYSEGKLNLKSHKVTIEPVQTFKAEEIKQIRNNIGATQALFANIIGVSPKTVEAWEAGRNAPDGPARRLLGMLVSDPTMPERYKIIKR